MPAASLLKYLCLSHFSRPHADRTIFRTIRRRRVSSIVELGVGDARRAVRMVGVAQRYSRLGGVSYTGIDLFESHPLHDGRLTLKKVHKLLKATGARYRLVPGDPFAALGRAANDLTGTDLVVIGADQDIDSLVRAWFYVPRLLHPASLVLVEQAAAGPKTERRYDVLPLDEIKRLAKESAPKRAA